MTDTPSQAALDAAVKPAGCRDWQAFIDDTGKHSYVRAIALAYAAHLDKADKVGRMVQAVGMIYTPQELFELQVVARDLCLPESIDPDLLEAREMFAEYHKQGGCDLMLNSGFIGKEGAANDLIMAGEFDHNPFVKMALKAIKRGRELAKERSE